jgi:DNA-binding MarR family transcriptional regulator
MTSAFPKPDRKPSRADRLVLLSSRDVDEVNRLMKLLTEASNTAVVETGSEPGPIVISRVTLVEAARQEFEKRRRRSEVLPDGIFGEPGWEILLQLYVQQQGTRMNIATLTGSLNLPASTVLRWLNYLQDKQFIRREVHPTDQRSVFVELTTTATKALDSYFFEVLMPV